MKNLTSQIPSLKKFNSQLSDFEDHDGSTFLDESLYFHYKCMNYYSFTLHPLSSREALSEVMADYNSDPPTPKKMDKPIVICEIREKKSAKISFSKEIEKFLEEGLESKTSNRLIPEVRCSSLKRISAKEVCTNFIFHQTLKETKKIVFCCF